MNEPVLPAKILTQMYPKASKWLRQLKEYLSVHSHTCEGNYFHQGKDLLKCFQLLWVNKDSAKAIPGPYKNETAFQCSFPSFFCGETCNVELLAFPLFFSFFLCHSYQRTIYNLFSVKTIKGKNNSSYCF